MLTRNLVPMLTNDWPDEEHLWDILLRSSISSEIQWPSTTYKTILEPAVRAVLRKAIAAGLSDLDMASIYRLCTANDGVLDPQ